MPLWAVYADRRPVGAPYTADAVSWACVYEHHTVIERAHRG